MLTYALELLINSRLLNRKAYKNTNHINPTYSSLVRLDFKHLIFMIYASLIVN